MDNSLQHKLKTINNMYLLKIISSTVRPGRKGSSVEKWIIEQAQKHSEFIVEYLDLSEINLPLMDEPNHPSLKKYVHEHTIKWSKTIDEADAFIFVTGEYDFNYPAPLRNALEFLNHEWGYKAAGIVSYGGVSAGTRAANALKGDLATFRMVPIMDMVNIPFFNKNINDDGEFIGSDLSEKAAYKMLRQILRWTKGLKSIKEDNIY